MKRKRSPDRVQAEYVIVGAGSAGCVIANRLSADPRVKVILIEAGGDDRILRNPRGISSILNVRIPAGFANLLGDPEVTWPYLSEADADNNGRVYPFPRGRLLGGSSSINGLIYMRGLPSDFDHWGQLGCAGWSWADVLPLFERSEAFEGPHRHGRGTQGPMNIALSGHRDRSLDAFVAACAEAGIPYVPDINDGEVVGIARTQQTTRRGIRESAATAYLHPVAHRRNLTILTNSTVTRVLMESGRAIGVEIVRGGHKIVVCAAAETILSAGAINTPKILNLSGIGSPSALHGVGIVGMVENHEVGLNLQDHFGVGLQATLAPGSDSLNQYSRGPRLFWQLLVYALRRDGMVSDATAPLTGYLRSRAGLDIPDLQVFAHSATIDHERTMARRKVTLRQRPGFTLTGYPSRPVSRGSVTLRSRAPQDHPVIRPRFLSAQADRDATIAMLRLFCGLFEQPSMQKLVMAFEPPFDFRSQAGDATLLDFARSTGFSAYHAAGTCRMGNDANSVTDPELRVRGVDCLRVADASIMPAIPSGNINAACIMIGEKAADLIVAR